MHAYLAKTTPNPAANRVPWYRLAAPCYAGLFLWVGYYQCLAEGTINRAPLGLLFAGLVVAAGISYALFYSVPALMGMQTGYPLGVIGSSTFGSRGAQLVPGLLAGILQAAWLGVAAFYAARLVLLGIGVEGEARSVPFIIVAVVWASGFAYAGTKGIGVASKLAVYLGVAPVMALLVMLSWSWEGLSLHGLEMPEPYAAFVYTIHLVTGFFAVAAVASPGIGLHTASKRDVRLAGLTGILAPAVFAGGVALTTVAGARALNPGLGSYGYIEAGESVAGSLGAVLPWLLVIGSIPASCALASMASDSFSVMLPLLGRGRGAVGVATLGIVLAISGLPGELAVFITVAGALCAPLCGIMAADYWLHGKPWPHTRPGINYAGYSAWILGFVTGIAPLLPIPEPFRFAAHPAAVYSWIAGFAGYIVLGNLGLKPYRRHRRKRVPVDSAAEGRERSIARKRK